MKDENDIAANILLIEGDDDSRDIFVRSIAMNFPSITVDVAVDPDDAVDLLSKGKYDIVVCDAFMALEAKVEFATELCGMADGGSVVVITGHPDLDIKSLPPHICVCDVLHKPLNLEELISKIKLAAQEAKKKRG